MPTTMTELEMNDLLSKVEKGQALSTAEVQKLADLLRAFALTVRTQDAQLQFIEARLEVLKDGITATRIAGETALSALQSVAPPTATVDKGAAMQAIEKFRQDIQNATAISQTVATAASFAISLAGKFI